MKTWRQMERLVDIGLARRIGTSNMTIPKLRLLLQDGRRLRFSQWHGSGGFLSPGFAEPPRPGPDTRRQFRYGGSVIVNIARRHGVHPAAVCLKWAVKRGIVPLPMSTKRKKYAANPEAIRGDWLSVEEMCRIVGIDWNCRLIKGQVFLWKSGQSWEDLWDLGGGNYFALNVEKS